jgi:hypothetical protein
VAVTGEGAFTFLAIVLTPQEKLLDLNFLALRARVPGVCPPAH